MHASCWESEFDNSQTHLFFQCIYNFDLLATEIIFRKLIQYLWVKKKSFMIKIEIHRIPDFIFMRSFVEKLILICVIFRYLVLNNNLKKTLKYISALGRLTRFLLGNRSGRKRDSFMTFFGVSAIFNFVFCLTLKNRCI